MKLEKSGLAKGGFIRKLLIFMQLLWSNKLNACLQFNEYEILNNAGKVTAEIAKGCYLYEFSRTAKEKTEKADWLTGNYVPTFHLCKNTFFC